MTHTLETAPLNAVHDVVRRAKGARSNVFRCQSRRQNTAIPGSSRRETAQRKPQVGMARRNRPIFAVKLPYHFIDRGRNRALDCPAPPSEPCMRISRTRLSSCEFAESSVARVRFGRRAKILQGFARSSSSAFDFPTHHSWLRASPRLFWLHASSSVSNRSCLFDGACLPKWFRFLPPLAPRALPRFTATMTALTSARPRLDGFLPAQISTVRHDNFHKYPAQPPPTIRFLTFDESCRSVRSWLAPQASPLASWLAIVEGRIGFTCVRVCAFASGCLPLVRSTLDLPVV